MGSQAFPSASRDKDKGLVGSLLNKAAAAAHAKLSAHLDKPTQLTGYQQPQSQHYSSPTIPPPTVSEEPLKPQQWSVQLPRQHSSTMVAYQRLQSYQQSHPPPYTPYNVSYQIQNDQFTSTNQHQPLYPTYQQPSFNTPQLPENCLSITTGIICPGCEVGLIPDDTCFRCHSCPDGRNIYCQTCHHHDRSCTHSRQQVRLALVAKDIKKKQDPKDELGFDYKCIGCKIRIKHLDFCWHCKECFSYPDTCPDCWKVKGKRCRHAGRKKIDIRSVRNNGQDGSGVDDTLDILDAVFG